MSETMQAYAAIGVTILLVMATAAGMLIAAHAIGPKRRGPVKDSPYESGLPVITDAQRFNIRFTSSRCSSCFWM
jgi:NADH:ubiquinone oxidoreductase subunit 3 (subunit A)